MHVWIVSVFDSINSFDIARTGLSLKQPTLESGDGGGIGVGVGVGSTGRVHEPVFTLQ